MSVYDKLAMSIILVDVLFFIAVFLYFYFTDWKPIGVRRWWIKLIGILSIGALIYFLLITHARAECKSMDKETLCLRLNNPMCIVARPQSDPWQGQIGKSKEGLAKFDEMSNGLRAGFITLRSYHFKHKIDSVERLLKRYATGCSKEYVKFVSSRLRVSSNAKINILHNMPELMEAIITFENGHCPFSRDYLRENFQVYVGAK